MGPISHKRLLSEWSEFCNNYLKFINKNFIMSVLNGLELTLSFLKIAYHSLLRVTISATWKNWFLLNFPYMNSLRQYAHWDELNAHLLSGQLCGVESCGRGKVHQDFSGKQHAIQTAISTSWGNGCSEFSITPYNVIETNHSNLPLENPEQDFQAMIIFCFEFEMLGTFIEASEHVTEWLAHSHQHNKDIVSSNMSSNFEILLTVSASHFLVNSNLIAMGQGYLLGRIWAMNAILEKSAPRSWPVKKL